MTHSNGVSAPFALRSLVASALLLGVAGLSVTAAAQTNGTPPQLLPYTAKLIAGSGTAVIGKGSSCPISGFTSTDAYGDGCLATEIELGNTAAGGSTPGARSAVADASGNVFFTDYQNGLVRRVDALTGVVTAVAGGASSSPGANTACGANVSTDAIGDGCLGTAVKLSHPAGIVFAPNGDLYFSDTGQAQVRKIAATGGVIPSTGGVISLIAGNVGGTYGYAASNATTTITIGSSSGYLHFPYGLAFDTRGDLFIVDEYTEAILVANTNTTGTNVVNGVSIAAGTIWKIAGSLTAGSAANPTNATYCTNGSGGGCNYGLYVENVQANGDEFDSTYSVAVGPDGTVYAGDEYYDSVFKVSPAGILSTYAGIQNSVGTKPTTGKRAVAGTFGVGSIFGIAADALSNVYFTDASSGAIWRVDGAGAHQYVVAGGAATVCSGATDALGDGCPATQALFGHSGSGNYATATLPGPGVYGVSVDTNADLFFGDTENNVVREIASGTQFGPVGANQPTQIVDVHFATGDGPLSSGAYSLIAGQTNFSLGTASCTTNSDNTTDCLLPITATPSMLGLFTGTLLVKSNTGQSAVFNLSGTYVQSPITRTSIAYSAPNVTCTGTNTYSTTTPVLLTSALVANGPNPPGGTVTFYANGAQIGTPQNVTNIGTTANPVYGATLSYTFTTANTYSVYSYYSGDSYFKPSTSTKITVISSNPTFTASAISYQQSTVNPGQTGLYSFTVAQNVYGGTISFACSGLPANSSCSFSPATLTAGGCSGSSIVALSIITQGPPAQTSAIGGGSGRWLLFSVPWGVGLALLIGLRRRKMPLRYSQLWMGLALFLCLSAMTACSSSINVAVTPAFSGNVTVTASGSAGTVVNFTVPLIVN